jgi:FtsH-binding integral membrane protein
MGITGFVEDPNIVVSAAVLIACITIGLTVYAVYTKTDFTMMGGALFVVFFLILGVGLLSVFTRSM